MISGEMEVKYIRLILEAKIGDDLKIILKVNIEDNVLYEEFFWGNSKGAVSIPKFVH